MSTSVENSVECRSDNDYAGRPLAIGWEGYRYLVKEVLDTWRSPSGKHYRVITVNGHIFDCFYSESDDLWKIEEL